MNSQRISDRISGMELEDFERDAFEPFIRIELNLLGTTLDACREDTFNVAFQRACAIIINGRTFFKN